MVSACHINLATKGYLWFLNSVANSQMKKKKIPKTKTTVINKK